MVGSFLSECSTLAQSKKKNQSCAEMYWSFERSATGVEGVGASMEVILKLGPARLF
jgi:hypothetical protein